MAAAFLLLPFYLNSYMTDVILPLDISNNTIQQILSVSLWCYRHMASKQNLPHCYSPYMKLMDGNNTIKITKSSLKSRRIDLSRSTLH
ncbi:hypothetical protein M5K25_018951 [Dendrobium thyrsiflorum]|uniref:Uncharacterized protein n=1 Tax=Dendrobium thyrsiflorum TaxID=117978 RepID=A0ABD0UDH6_DENTH